MEQEYRSLMIRSGKGELLKSMLVKEQLLDYLQTSPLHVDELDATSTMTGIDYICDRICERMSNVEQLTVSKEQVMLLWLTNQIYHPSIFKSAYERATPL